MPREKRRKSPEVGYQPKKRQAKTSFVSPEATRTPRDRILIVCEDSKSFPDYMKALKRDLELTNTVIIYGEGGSAPSSVYKDAIIQLDKNIESQDDTFDRVYCVFDKDTHAYYQSTLDKITSNSEHEGVPIYAIPSIPCFEIWVLFHFCKSTKPFDNSTDVIRELKSKSYLSEYTKESLSDLYTRCLKDKTKIAIQNSKYVFAHAEKNETDNPSSKLHILIEDLLKESKKG